MTAVYMESLRPSKSSVSTPLQTRLRSGGTFFVSSLPLIHQRFSMSVSQVSVTCTNVGRPPPVHHLGGVHHWRLWLPFARRGSQAIHIPFEEIIAFCRRRHPSVRLALADDGHPLVIDRQMEVFHRAELLGEAEGDGQHIVKDRRFLVPELVEVLHLEVELGAGAEDFFRPAASSLRS